MSEARVNEGAGPTLKRNLTLWPLIGIVFFTVGGGVYGIEIWFPAWVPG